MPVWGKMKILSISDCVDPILGDSIDRERFGDVDLAISCGDLPPEYLTGLVDALNIPLFYVRGNHDIRYRTSPPRGCVNLHRRVRLFRGVRFLGLEGSRWYNGGPVQYTEQEMRSFVRRLRPGLWFGKGVDVIVTHAPPRGIHDEEDPCHRGFMSFCQLIDRYRPIYFLHGHIHRTFEHPSQRFTQRGRTKVVNCYGHILLEIDEEALAGARRQAGLSRLRFRRRRQILR